MKKKNCGIRTINALILISIVVILTFYFAVFHEGISHDQSLWGDFSTYFSGLIMPILSIINIYVFIKLTRSISDEDGRRAKIQIQVQKNMTLMQLRVNEIRELDKMLSSAFVPSKEDVIDSYRSIVVCIAYLDNFIHTRLSLFGLDEKSELFQSLNELYNGISIYYGKIKKVTRLDSSDITPLLKKKDEVIKGLNDQILSSVDGE